MTQTPSNNGNSSRLDRIEAILERTVENNTELRSALTQLTQQVGTLTDGVDTLTNRVDIVTRRMDNFVERVGRYEEQNTLNNSELVRGQAMMTDVIRQLTLGQVRLEQAIVEIKETQASLTAAQERQERILDYLIRRSE